LTYGDCVRNGNNSLCVPPTVPAIPSQTAIDTCQITP
jgi:hypothetical protein